MTNAHDYFLTVKAARDAIAAQFGLRADRVPTDMRFLADADLAVTAILAKALVDQGVVTDTGLQSALTDAANGSDGSVWSDTPPPPTGATFDDFSVFGEGFEIGANGDPATADNTPFVHGPVGTSMLPTLGSLTFDTSTSAGGAKSLKTVTADGWSRALRTDTYADASEAYVRFYFRATAAPATSGCRVFAWQFGPAEGTDPDAERWSLEVSVDSAGAAALYVNGTLRASGGTPPNICDGQWWRVEVGFYGVTCECRVYLLTGTTPTISWTAPYAAGPVNSAMVGQPRSALTSGQSWTTWHDDLLFDLTTWVGP